MKIIPTKDAAGRPNGWLGLIWKASEEPELRPDQVYVTAIAPGCMKGPHLHHKARSVFRTIKGEVNILMADGDGGYSFRGKDAVIEAGTPAALYNLGSEEALVLNLRSPEWTADDDHMPDNWRQWPSGEYLSALLPGPSIYRAVPRHTADISELIAKADAVNSK